MRQQFNDQSRGTRKRCTKCGSSFLYATLDGTKLSHSALCPKCEVEARIAKLLESYRA